MVVFPVEIVARILGNLESCDIFRVVLASPDRNTPIFQIAEHALYTHVTVQRPAGLAEFVETLVQRPDLAQTVISCRIWPQTAIEADSAVSKHESIIPIAIALMHNVESIALPIFKSTANLYHRCTAAAQRLVKLKTLSIGSLVAQSHYDDKIMGISALGHFQRLTSLKLYQVVFNADTDAASFPNVRHLDVQLRTREALPLSLRSFWKLFSELETFRLTMSSNWQETRNIGLHEFLNCQAPTLRKLSLVMHEDIPSAWFRKLSNLKHLKIHLSSKGFVNVADLPNSVTHLELISIQNLHPAPVEIYIKSTPSLQRIIIQKFAFCSAETSNLYLLAHSRGIALNLTGNVVSTNDDSDSD